MSNTALFVVYLVGLVVVPFVYYVLNGNFGHDGDAIGITIMWPVAAFIFAGVALVLGVGYVVRQSARPLRYRLVQAQRRKTREQRRHLEARRQVERALRA